MLYLKPCPKLLCRPLSRWSKDLIQLHSSLWSTDLCSNEGMQFGWMLFTQLPQPYLRERELLNCRKRHIHRAIEDSSRLESARTEHARSPQCLPNKVGYSTRAVLPSVLGAMSAACQQQFRSLWVRGALELQRVTLLRDRFHFQSESDAAL